MSSHPISHLPDERRLGVSWWTVGLFAQISLMHHIHNENGPTVIRLDPGVTIAPGQPACIGLCAEKQQTIDVHYRAIRLAALLILLTNMVLVLWALALRGGRLWARRRA